MTSLSYLTRRGGGRYYLQIRMPRGPDWPDLLRLSLHTSDLKNARASLLHALIWLMPFRDAESLTRQAEEVLAQCRRFVRSGPAMSWPALEDRQRFEITFGDFAREVKHYNVPGKTRLELIQAWAFFTDMLRRDEIRLYDGGQARHAPAQPLPPATTVADSTDWKHEPIPTAGTATPKPRGRGRGRKASALLTEFLSEQAQSNGHDGARGDVGIYVEFMIALLGDRALRDYTEDDLTRLGRELANIPSREGMPRRTASSLWKRYRHAKDHGWNGLTRLSETTLKNRYKTGLDRFFSWAKSNSHIATATRIKVVLSAENLVALPRDAFTDTEIEQILSMPSFTGCKAAGRRWQPGPFLIQDHIYWGYITMLLTGMRTSEVAQLEVDDVLEGEGFYFFNMQLFDPSKGRVARQAVRRLKTSDAARSIPLDLLMIDLGFLDRVNALRAAGEQRLFPDWESYKKPSGKVLWDRPLTRDWQYRRHKLKLDRKNISLYSSRHAFGDRLDKAQVPDRIRDRLLGHSPMGSRGRYGSKAPADPELAAVLQRLETPVIQRMRAILMPPYERALSSAGTTLLKPWLTRT